MPPPSLPTQKQCHWFHGILQRRRPSRKASSPANKAEGESQTQIMIKEGRKAAQLCRDVIIQEKMCRTVDA